MTNDRGLTQAEIDYRRGSRSRAKRLERLVSALEDAELDEDAEDIAAVAAARAADTAILARYNAARGQPVETTIPLEVVKAELEGTHPIRAWREHRGWTPLQLSLKSRVSLDFIDHMEMRRKTGSVATLNRIARALHVPIEMLFEEDVVAPRAPDRKEG